MPTSVSVKCVVKELFDGSLKSGLISAMTKAIKKVIDTRSGGKLTSEGTTDDGIDLTATLLSLKADNKDKPTRLEAEMTFAAVKTYPSAKTFKAFRPSTGTQTGVGSNVQAAANGLMEDMLDWEQPPMKTVMKALLSL